MAFGSYDIRNVPNSMKRAVEICFEESDKQKEYRKIFKEILAKYKVESPDELDEDKRREFYDEVDAAWESKKEDMSDSDASKDGGPASKDKDKDESDDKEVKEAMLLKRVTIAPWTLEDISKYPGDLPKVFALFMSKQMGDQSIYDKWYNYYGEAPKLTEAVKLDKKQAKEIRDIVNGKSKDRFGPDQWSQMQAAIKKLLKNKKMKEAELGEVVDQAFLVECDKFNQ